MIVHVQYLDSHGMFSISSETRTAREVPLTDAVLLSRGRDRQGWAQIDSNGSDAMAMLLDASDRRQQSLRGLQQANLSHVFLWNIAYHHRVLQDGSAAAQSLTLVGKRRSPKLVVFTKPGICNRTTKEQDFDLF
jgi:hypothetical protein